MSEADFKAGRPRTALVRVLLILAGKDWKDGDFEDEKRYRMQQFPWLRWEAYAAALVVALYVTGLALWLWSRVVDPAGIVFWLLVPVFLLVSFVVLQVLIGIGSFFAGVLKCNDIEAGISSILLFFLTLPAIGICLSGGGFAIVLGSAWLVIIGLNVLAAMAERVLVEK